MALSPAAAVTTSQDRLPPCPFTKKLPLEIRRCIYRYFLSGSYIKRDLNVNCRQYDARRISILSGPDHSYHFDLSILAINKQIRSEAIDFFKRNNTLVYLTHEFEEEQSRNPDHCLERCGVAVIAKDERARTFPAIGISIDFRMNYTSSFGHMTGCLQKRAHSVFLLEDLSAACIPLQRMAKISGRSIISVTISPHIVDSLVLLEDGSPTAGSKLYRCLENLRQIQGIGHAEILGPVESVYKSSITADMYEKWTAKKAMDLVEARFDEGDKAALKGRFSEAILGYEAAVHVIRGNLWGCGPSEHEEMLVSGRFSGVWARWALADAQVKLHALIADAYLKLGKYRLARVWVERIYGPLHTWDRRHSRVKFPLQIPDPQLNGAQPAVYANLLVVAARISIIHGHDHDAIVELCEALRLDPSNETVERMIEECQTRSEARSEAQSGRRRSKEAQQAASSERKYQAALKVVHDRKNKADDAFGDHNLSVAYEKYEAAYRKIRIIQDTDDSYVPHETQLKRLYELKLVDVLSRLTIIALEFGNYSDVHRWAANIHACIPIFLILFQGTTWSDGESRESVMYAKNAFWTAYYCKGVALQKQGNYKAAIRNFENAVLCDDGCHATYYQLEATKKAEKLETLKQEAAKEKLQRHQELLRARKDRKAKKNMSKHARKRVKKARGPGYVIGVGV